MALVAHNGSVVVGDVLGSEYLGTVSGFKVLSKIYVEVIEDYRYVVQHGEVKKGEDKFSPFGLGKDLGLLSYKEIKEYYSKKWTKAPDVKDGDVLRSSDGTHVFVVRGTIYGEPKLYRVSAGSNLYDRLSSYERSYGKLSQVTMNYGAGRFSEPVTASENSY